MGIISDAEFERELVISNPISDIPKEPVLIPDILPMDRPGRKEGDNNVPDSLRKIIGETSNIEGRASALAIAEALGISPSSVSAYAEGATSTATIDKTPNKPHITQAKLRAQGLASRKLRKAMLNITDDKLRDAKPGELAVVARNMAAIIKEMEPEENNGKTEKDKPQFIIYSPQIRDERHFEVTVARE